MELHQNKKVFFSLTGNIQQSGGGEKKQSMEWERIFANQIFNKGLISKIHKELK